jgi:hypothetical protein
MKIIGFNFTKLDLEKKSSNLKDLKISTQIDITEIQETKSDFFKSSEELIAIQFEYSVNYEENIAHLKFNGGLIVSVDSKQAKEVLKQWKEKKIPEEFKLGIFNIVLRKSTLKALQFEEEFNLPPHVPLPIFKPSEDKK